jgi:hypothetical protein
MADEFQVLIPGAGARIPATTAPPGPTAPLPDGHEFLPLLAALKSTCADEKANQCKQPEITLRREGDRITQISIQCGCGQVIELGCQYPS